MKASMRKMVGKLKVGVRALVKNMDLKRPCVAFFLSLNKDDKVRARKSGQVRSSFLYKPEHYKNITRAFLSKSWLEILTITWGEQLEEHWGDKVRVDTLVNGAFTCWSMTLDEAKK